VLGAGKRFDPGVAARVTDTAPPHSAVRPRAYRARRGGSTLSVLTRLRKSGAISREKYDAYRDEYKRCRAFAATLSGARALDMRGVLRNVDQIAAGGGLNRTRLDPLWLILQRNREWWSSGPLLASGTRVSFKGSELIFQYFPGEGLQLHPLANFGKLNALAGLKLQRDRMTKLMNELLPLAATRAGGLAWEYYFDFGGGAPPWVSSLSQGTALQSLARAATKAGVAAEVLPRLRRGLAVFKKRTPAGVRVPVAGPGDHYAQYSFAPGLRILNGFIQSLNGLYDFARLAADETARRLFEAGDARAKREVPTYDTGAWSLYSRGTSYHESSLEYHVLLRDFLQELCDRTQEAVHCRAAEHFTRYLDEAPVIRVLTHRLRAGRPGALRFRLSKISSVTVNLYRGGENVYSYSATLAFGRHALTIKPPRSAREYEVRTTATDLAGNTGDSTARVTVSRP
jgi:D-glucuronyl C5-epimerase-like protein